MAKNVYSLQLLRNGTPFSSYTAAVEAITSGTEQDGVLKLARYTDSNSEDPKYRTGSIKTIFGIRHVISGATGGTGWTVFDSYTEVIENLQQQIDAMGGDSGSIAEQIKSAIDALNYTGVTTGDGVVVTNVIQESGVVSADSAEVGGLKLTNFALGSDSGAVAANDTINEAISKLQNQVNKANEDAEEAIKALDGSITAETGYYINKVDEVDGVISGTTAALPTVAAISSEGQAITAVSQSLGTVDASYGDIAAAHVTVADAGNLFSSTTVEATLAEIVDKYTAADAALKTEILGGASASADTLGELETLINNLEAGAATYTIRKDTESLPAEIKERYTLVETKNGQSTDKQVTIDIPKDSHIVSINYLETGDHAQNLEYVYIDASGNTQTTYVDMAHLILESEFASGVTSTNGVAHGVVDPTSESFLTVGENGFKLTGVSGLVDNQIAALDASVTGGTTAGTATSNHVQVVVDEVDGKLTAVTVTETNIADKSALDALSAKTVTEIGSSDGSINVSTAATTAADGTVKYDIKTDASMVDVSTAYTAGTNTAIAAGDSVDTALAKLEAQVAAAKTAATTKVVEGTDTASVMTIDESVADSGNTYTINLSNIAKADAVGLGTDGSHVAAQGAYTSEATTIAGEIAALDAALNTVSGKVDDAQAEIDRIESGAGLSNSGAYVPNTANTYTSGATSLADAIDKLDAAAKENKILAGDGIDVNESSDGTTVAVKLKASVVDGEDKWDNPLGFDDNGALYFDSIDAGTY